MRRSKLEIYIDVLEAFAKNGPIRLTKVTLKAKISYIPLKKITANLVAENLVEEKRTENYMTYSATPKAKMVLSRLKEIKQSLPSLEQSLPEISDY